jgi:hypothetical protein
VVAVLAAPEVAAGPAPLAASFAISAERRAHTRFLLSALVPGGRQSVSVLRRRDECRRGYTLIENTSTKPSTRNKQ